MRGKWRIMKLEELTEVFSDGDWIETKNQSAGGIRLIQTGNVGNGVFKDRGEKARYISHDTFKKLRCTEIFANDVLVSRLPDPVGRACELPEVGERMITAVDCTIIRFDNSQILSKWFVYYTLSNEYSVQIESQVTGATRQRISRKNLGLIEIPIPSIVEQNRIVEILDEAFAAIDKAKANVEKNLQNAKEFFDNYLESIIDGNMDYVQTTLKESVDLLTGFPFKSKFYTEAKDDVLLLRGDNIMQGYLRWTDSKRWSRTEYNEYSKFQLKKDDIILAMDRPWVKAGLKCAKISDDDVPSLLVQRTARLRSNGKMNTSFLFYLIRSKKFTTHLLSLQTGIGVPHISAQQILSFPFSRPPIKVQETIASNLDLISEDVIKLNGFYQQKMSNLEELRKSFLQKAFNGELTTSTNTLIA